MRCTWTTTRRAKYLRRLAEKGHLHKRRRGLFVVPDLALDFGASDTSPESTDAANVDPDTVPKPLEGREVSDVSEPLVCDVDADDHQGEANAWGEPYSVTRCVKHNPLTYRPEPEDES
jgi:hypothetical protein